MIRVCVRAVSRAPWFSAAMVAVSAIAFATAVPVLAIVDGVLFKPLPYPGAERLWVVQGGLRGDAPAPGVSVVDVAAWADAVPEVAFTAYSANPGLRMDRRANEPEYGQAWVQPSFFDVLGVHPLIGGFAPEDFRHRELVEPVIVSYDIWQLRYQGETSVLGRTEILDPTTGSGYRVVGVMPQGFVFPVDRTTVKFILPLVAYSDPKIARANPSLPFVIARLPQSMNAAQLQSRVESGMAVLARSLPPREPRPIDMSERLWRQLGPFDQATVESLSSHLRKPQQRFFSWTLATVLGLVVLAALSASALIMARAADREVEFGYRLALGASISSLVRLLVLDVLVLAAIGVLLATPVAFYLLRIALDLLPRNMALLKDVAVDLRVALLGVALFVAYVACAVLTPAIYVAVTASRRTIRRFSRAVLPNAVTAFQVAGGLALALGGLLFGRSLMTAYAHGPVIGPEQVLVINAQVQGTRDSVDRDVRLNAMIDRLATIPGVEAVGLREGRLLTGGAVRSSWWVSEPSGSERAVDLDIQAVSPGYYRVMQPQLTAGRLPSESTVNPIEVVVSESVGQAAWPNGSALGRPLLTGRNEPLTVVGIVRDARWLALDKSAGSGFGPYRAFARSNSVTFVLRTVAHSGETLASALRTIEITDPLIRVYTADTLDRVMMASLRDRRLQAWAFGGLAVGGIGIVVLSILGTMAMATVRRRRESVIRQVLGATRRVLLVALARRQVAPVAVGLGVGAVLVSWLLTMAKPSFHGITLWDAPSWAMAATIVLVVVAIGSLGPTIVNGSRNLAHELREHR